MKKKIFSGDLFSRSQEINALISKYFRNLKLYRMRLVSTQLSIFDDHPSSDQLELFEKAMKADMDMVKEFKFRHPKDSGEIYVRRYIGCSLNGNAFLMVGQFKKGMDFAFVRIMFHSVIYHEPYIVVEKCSQSLRNPDTLARMVEGAINWVLKGQGLQIKLEPWKQTETVMWLLDYEMSYLEEMEKANPADLIMIGYEEALKMRRILMTMKEESKKPKIIKKSDDIWTYILTENKEGIIRFLHQVVKGQKTAKGIARPFRFLFDHQFTEHIPFKAVMKEFPELKGLIKERSYNDWTNPNSTSYDNDPQYKKIKDSFNLFQL